MCVWGEVCVGGVGVWGVCVGVCVGGVCGGVRVMLVLSQFVC